MSLLFSRYCILYSNTNIYFIFKYFFLCVCKYFFLNVDRSSLKTFQNPVLLTSQVLHPKNLYKLLLQIIQKNSRDTYVQLYKLSPSKGISLECKPLQRILILIPRTPSPIITIRRVSPFCGYIILSVISQC